MSEESSRSDAPAGARPGLVVGVGASAGGLEAFRELLSVLPSEAGVTVLLVQHLDPTHPSLLGELIASRTRMRVCDAVDGDPLAPNTVYVIPPDTYLAVRDGRIELTAPRLVRGVRLPVDHLFASLAREFPGRAVGIVLSGAGSDGSAGVRELRRAGGLAIVQDPSTASQRGMPQSAIETGLVDAVLPIAEMPEVLHRFRNLPPSALGGEAAEESPGEANDQESPPSAEADRQDLTAGGRDAAAPHFARLGAILEVQAGFPLRSYKRSTVERRVLRRMLLAGFDDLETYVDHVQNHPAEQLAVLRDLLISVTEFFRDEEAFDALRTMVIDPMVERAADGDSLRAWVSGCATGEEAYSVAIELLEGVARSRKTLSVHVFATDVDTEALTVARAGVYSPTSFETVPDELVTRYFRQVDARHYRVTPRLRDVVSFAAHDITRDPPFSRMHLVSCRNMLIYLRQAVQEQVLRNLHFALLPDGVAFLGSSESLGTQRSLFATLSKKWRLFRKVGPSRVISPMRSSARPRSVFDTPPEALSAVHAHPARAAHAETVGRAARNALMRAMIPPSVVVAESGEILFMHGELRPFLRFPEGEPVLALGDLVDEDLSTRTRAAMYKCRRDGVRVEAIASPVPGRPEIRITANPAFDIAEGAVTLSFATVATAGSAPHAATSSGDDSVIRQLERELIATQEDLRNTVDELESANEELRTANEESTSVNEELQSTNEELEATTEELRSLNEELMTVNAQLRDKVDQLEVAHDDLSNFFSSTKIATLFLNDQLLVKRFTPAAEALLNIDHAHLGRFIGDIARELLHGGLVEAARDVLETLAPSSTVLRDGTRRWISRQVLPYRTESRRVEGVVVTFTDITDLRSTSERLLVRETQQAQIARLGTRALESTDLQSYLDRVVRDVQQVLNSDFCKILELQPDGDVFRLRAGVGWNEGLIGSAGIASGLDSQAGYAINSREPVVVEDLTTERRFRGSALFSDHGIVSGISCVIGPTSEPYGVLGVHSRTRRAFTADEVLFLQSVAEVIGGAVMRDAARARLSFGYSATRSLAESDSALDAARRLFLAAVDELGMEVGEYWQRAADGLRIERLAVFGQGAFTTERVLAELPADESGRGLPARILRTQEAEWLSSLQEPERLPQVLALRALGLRSGIAIPIVSGAVASGVFCAYSTRMLHADRGALRGIEPIGRVMGEHLRGLDLEQRLRQTVEQAPLGIADRSLDGTWLRVNQWFCDITGFDAYELVGTAHDFSAPSTPTTDAVQLGNLRGGDGQFRAEQQIVRKDGSLIWVNHSAQVVPQPSGSPSYAVVAMEDISARKAAEFELRVSEQRFREVLQRSPVPIMLFDEHGVVLAINAAWTLATGYTLADIPSVDAWRALAFRERAGEMATLSRETWNDGRPEHEFELEVHTKSGEQKVFIFRAIEIGTAATGDTLRVATAADVTHQRQYERELLRQSTEKDTFIAMLGHELRNPLAAVLNASELLQAMPDDPARVARMHAIVSRSAQHMSSLLDGLLDISRITHGKITLDRRTLDLRALVARVVDDTNTRLRGTRPSIELHRGSDPLWVEGDEVRLAQVIDNLVSNSLKYSLPAGRVHVTLERVGDQARMRVRDEGVGIEPSLLPHLFVAFRQGAQTLGREQGGLGLGLALVKLLIELHGGSVTASNNDPGPGAEFVATMPLVDAPAASGKNAREPAPAHESPRTVLVIEDNRDAAETLALLLEMRGFVTHTAATGEEGLATARRITPDVVVCDLGLPHGVSGYDVARALRAEPATRDARLIALSGYAGAEDQRRGREAGFDAHAAKPVELDELLRLF